MTLSKFVPAPHVSMVAVPESAGVHWKTRSGALPELPQLPACKLAPLVVPLKVPPWAGIAVGLLQAPASVVVVVAVAIAVVVGDPVEVVVVARVDGRRRTPRTSRWRCPGWPSRAGRPPRST